MLIVHALQIGKTKYLTGSEKYKLTYSFYEDDGTYSKKVDFPEVDNTKYIYIKSYYKGLYQVDRKAYQFISLSRKGIDTNSLQQFYYKNFYSLDGNEKSLEDKVIEILVKKLVHYKLPKERQEQEF